MNRPPRSSRLFRPIVATTALACVVGALLAAAPASAASANAASAYAASAYPAAPAHVHVVSATSTSLTVASDASANATLYRLYVSTVRSDVTVPAIRYGRTTSARHFAGVPSPRVTVDGLDFTNAPYYYRFVALNGDQRAYSPTIGRAGLRPATPTGLRATRTARLTMFLTWASGAQTGYSVRQATNAAMTANVESYAFVGHTEQFTPYKALRTGGRYYFQVRSYNNGTPSAYSAVATSVAGSRLQGVRVMTYNILKTATDGQRASGHRIAAWSRRGPVAARLIHRADPAVVAVQEGNDPIRRGRQVDTLATYLSRSGPNYAVAKTGPQNLAGGPYVVYRPDLYRAVGTGGHWDLDSRSTSGLHRYAAFQAFRSTDTGASFLFVCMHLVAGHGRSYDRRREAETIRVTRLASARAVHLRMPLVYAGDVNSSSAAASSYALDGPGVALQDAHVTDAHLVAQTRSAARYNTVNLYRRHTAAAGVAIDGVFAAPGVAVSSYGLLLVPSRGVIPSDHDPAFSYVYFGY